MSTVQELNIKIGALLSGMKSEEIVEILSSDEKSLLAASHQQQQQQQQQRPRQEDPIVR